MLEKTLRLNYLFDFYQALLTPKQRDYLQMYYLEDLSLVEIADITNVSRQAVYDNIKRSEAILETYEEKLLLYEKYEKRNILLTDLEKYVKADDRRLQQIIAQLRELG